MYGSFVSYRQICLHLEFLTREGLLEHNEVDRYYSITFKGTQFLELYKKMAGMLKVNKDPN